MHVLKLLIHSQIVLQKNCINFFIHQQCLRGPIFPPQAFYSLVSLDISGAQDQCNPQDPPQLIGTPDTAFQVCPTSFSNPSPCPSKPEFQYLLPSLPLSLSLFLLLFLPFLFSLKLLQGSCDCAQGYDCQTKIQDAQLNLNVR